MQVTLSSFTPNPEKTIVHATRTCYQSFQKQDEVSNLALLKHIIKKGESPLEFAHFIFDIQGVSRALSHQLVRHRMASFAQKSQRYCAEVVFEYITPPAIAAQPAIKHKYNEAVLEIQKQYNILKALGIKSEDARYLLPNACCTHLVCGINARSLRNFLLLRSSKQAQWEIRNLAVHILDCLRPIAPVYTGVLDSLIRGEE